MILNDFIPLIKAAERYTKLIKFMNGRPERDLAWDLTIIEAVQRDFHLVATPTTVTGLFSLAQQLNLDLEKARQSLADYQQELARLDDVMAVSASGNVITLPIPLPVTGDSLEKLSVRDVVEHLRTQGFEVRGVPL
ncbi:hypothetical protein ACCY16_02020 [Candidatus Pantoea formicae]|uniref:hypothetical protein n=1 Tax=Candidatus Pantoea formicae TaxID=2608355 RepID=UPI003EDB3FD7